jgi:hypothetical protein
MSTPTNAGSTGGRRSAPEWLLETEKWDLIPEAEQDALIIAVSEAVDLAAAGRPEAGEEILLTGLQRAEDHWNGNPWGGDLVLCYQAALNRFHDLHSRGSSFPADTGA